MPRTKAPRRRLTRAERVSIDAKFENGFKHFNTHVKIKQGQLISFYESKLKVLKDTYDVWLNTNQADLHKTVGQLREEALKKNSTLPNMTTSTCLQSTRSSAASRDDDGIENKVKRSTRRVSRSLSRANSVKVNRAKGVPYNMGPSSSRLPTRTNRRSVSCGSARNNQRVGRPFYQTPLIRPGAAQYPPITPKVAPNTAVALLRRPRQGEMVVSLSGSPLLVNSVMGTEDKANCNIPLSDGTILSLLPNKLRESTSSSLPFEHIKPETRQQLEVLHNNLDAYLKNLRMRNKK